MDIIVFGTGKVGKNAISFLEKQYHILFFVDNDEKKWETIFENFPVKSPEEIKRYSCDIIIASTKYCIEIMNQLEQMGIRQNRIYFCRKYQKDIIDAYEFYPLLEERIKSTEASLVDYDLLHKNEYETCCRKVLIFCSFFSTYTKQLIENISKRCNDIEFSLLTNAKESKEKIVSEQLKHIYYYQTMADLKTILERLPIYDAMELLWMENEWVYFYQLIRMKAKRLNLHVGGSDFYRAGEKERNFRQNLIQCADCVIVQTEGTKQELETFYGEIVKDKLFLLPYGIEVLDEIKCRRKISGNSIKKKFCVPLNRFVVICGHNANAAHQHEKIIDALDELSEEIKRQIVLVFPMTYPKECDEYINNICERLKISGISYVVLRKFMSFEEMAELALISDIMIHVQTTDQLSSAMLEQMYAGSIIIAGKWLPYRSLHEMGIFFIDIDAISAITKTLEEVITNIKEYKKKCLKNKEIIWKHSSWDELAIKWRSLWEEKTRRI